MTSDLNVSAAARSFEIDGEFIEEMCIRDRSISIGIPPNKIRSANAGYAAETKGRKIGFQDEKSAADSLKRLKIGI